MGKYQSGQMGQTVNLLAYAFGGSNPSLPTLSYKAKLSLSESLAFSFIKLSFRTRKPYGFHHTNHMVYMTETATLEHLNCHFRLANLPLLNTPCAPLFIILHKPLILLVFLLEQNINKPHNHMAYLSPPIQSE